MLSIRYFTQQLVTWKLNENSTIVETRVPWRSSGFKTDAVKSVHAIQGLRCRICRSPSKSCGACGCAAVALPISLRIRPHIVFFCSYSSKLSLLFCLIPFRKLSDYMQMPHYPSHMLHDVLGLSPFLITSFMSVESLRSNGFLLGT